MFRCRTTHGDRHAMKDRTSPKFSVNHGVTNTSIASLQTHTAAEHTPAIIVPALLAEYMTPDELAAELHICKRTLDRWHARRIGPPRVMIGRKPYYRRAGTADWIRSQERNFTEERVGRARRRRTS